MKTVASPAGAILLSILMVIMSSAFGLMLATLARTERSASAIAVLTSLVLAPLGGCWWPLFITPRWMQFIAKITPHGWATTGFNKLLVFSRNAGTCCLCCYIRHHSAMALPCQRSLRKPEWYYYEGQVNRI